MHGEKEFALGTAKFGPGDLVKIDDGRRGVLQSRTDKPGSNGAWLVRLLADADGQTAEVLPKRMKLLHIRCVGRRCRLVCTKTGKSQAEMRCRLGYGPDGRPLVEVTHVDDDSRVVLRSNFEHAVSRSQGMQYVLRCNNCFELIFTGDL